MITYITFVKHIDIWWMFGLKVGFERSRCNINHNNNNNFIATTHKETWHFWPGKHRRSNNVLAQVDLILTPPRSIQLCAFAPLLQSRLDSYVRYSTCPQCSRLSVHCLLVWIAPKQTVCYYLICGLLRIRRYLPLSVANQILQLR